MKTPITISILDLGIDPEDLPVLLTLRNAIVALLQKDYGLEEIAHGIGYGQVDTQLEKDDKIVSISIGMMDKEDFDDDVEST